MGSGLQVRLFGSPKILLDGDPLPPFLTHKSRELFGYLAANPNRGHPRLLLAGLLWPETTDDKARASLSTELWRLRRVLGSLQDRLTLSRDEVVFSVDPLQVDSRLFVELSQKQDYPSLKQSVDLYDGDFLEGCYADWCILEREQLKDVYLKTLERLLSYHEARGEWLEAVSYAKRLVGNDPLREELHRTLMKLYLSVGDRPAALAQYRACADGLKRELGIEPMPETRRLFEQIRFASQVETLWSTRVEAARDLTRQKISELKRSRQYLPEVFTSRSHLEETMRQFVLSPSAGLILTGPSGYGKTTWLVHWAEDRLEQGDLVLYYSAGSLTLTFERDLTRHAWGNDSVTAAEALVSLGREAWKNGKSVWILVDDLNNFRDLGATPADLLRRLDRFICDPELQDEILAGRCSLKLVITCRDYTWKQIAENGLVELNWNAYFGSQPHPVGAFEGEELKRAFQNYCRHFDMQGSMDDFRGDVRGVYRHPLLLRLLSETWRGRRISPIHSEALLFREYFLKMVPQASIRQFCMDLSAWMTDQRRTSVRLSELHKFARTYGMDLPDEPALKQLLDAGVLVSVERGARQVIQFAHDRLFEYLLAEYMLVETEQPEGGASVFAGYAQQVRDFFPMRGAVIMALSLCRDPDFFLSLAVHISPEARELCVDGLTALYAEDPQFALSTVKKILALESVDAKRAALKAAPAMGEEGYELFYSAVGSASETIRRVALISFDQLWRQDFQRAVRVMRRLIEDINPQMALTAPRRIQTLFRIVGWFSTYDIPVPVFSEVDSAAYEFAVEKLRLPTSGSETRFWSLIKNILARNTISWPANEDAVYEIVRPDSLTEKERIAFRHVLSTLRRGSGGLNDVSIGDIKTLLQSQVDPARYPAHHQLAVWLHHRPWEAGNAMRSLFDDVDAHAQLWCLMAFLPSSLSPPVPFPWDVLHLLEEFTARFAEENEAEFFHGAERGVLYSLGGVSFLPLGIRYIQAGGLDFPFLSSLLTLSKDSPEKFALTVRLLAPVGWFHPRECLNFLDAFLDFKQPLHARTLETFANMRIFHPGIVDAHLQERGVDRGVQHRIKTSADLEQVTYRAHLISTQDVRITSILLGSPYGAWLTDCVLPGYLDSKTPQEAAHRFGDGLFETLRQCDWHLKRLLGLPD